MLISRSYLFRNNKSAAPAGLHIVAGVYSTMAGFADSTVGYGAGFGSASGLAIGTKNIGWVGTNTANHSFTIWLHDTALNAAKGYFTKIIIDGNTYLTSGVVGFYAATTLNGYIATWSWNIVGAYWTNGSVHDGVIT